MFGALKSMFSPMPKAAVSVGLPPEVDRQVRAIARIGGLNLRNQAVLGTALAVAVVGLRLGIDFTSDPLAPAKFMACVRVLSGLQGTGINATDPRVLDMMAEALRETSWER